MLPESRDRNLVESILTQCSKINRYLVDGSISKESFFENEDCQDLCILAIIQIGECSNRLSESFIISHPEIDWKSLYGMRCVLTHDYLRIDRNVLWETVSSDIPKLANVCKIIISD